MKSFFKENIIYFLFIFFYFRIKEFLGYLLFLLLGIAPQIMQNSLFSEVNINIYYKYF